MMRTTYLYTVALASSLASSLTPTTISPLHSAPASVTSINAVEQEQLLPRKVGLHLPGNVVVHDFSSPTNALGVFSQYNETPPPGGNALTLFSIWNSHGSPSKSTAPPAPAPPPPAGGHSGKGGGGPMKTPKIVLSIATSVRSINPQTTIMGQCHGQINPTSQGLVPCSICPSLKWCCYPAGPNPIPGFLTPCL